MNKGLYVLYKSACYVLSLLLTICICATCAFAILSATCSNDSFVSKYFTSEEVTQRMRNQLSDNLKELSETYALPETVLTDALSDDFLKSAQMTASSPIRGGVPIDFLGSDDVINRYENALKKYNSENRIKISDKKIKKISKRAAEIFNSTYTIGNAAQFGSVSKVFVNRAPALAFLFAGFGAVLSVVLYFVNGRRSKGFNYHAMAMMTAGDLMIAVPVFLQMKGLFSRLSLTTVAAYNDAINNSFHSVLILCIIIGAILLLLGAVIFTSVYRHYVIKAERKNIENEIQRNLI